MLDHVSSSSDVSLILPGVNTRQALYLLNVHFTSRSKNKYYFKQIIIHLKLAVPWPCCSFQFAHGENDSKDSSCSNFRQIQCDTEGNATSGKIKRFQNKSLGAVLLLVTVRVKCCLVVIRIKDLHIFGNVLLGCWTFCFSVHWETAHSMQTSQNLCQSEHYLVLLSVCKVHSCSCRVQLLLLCYVIIVHNVSSLWMNRLHV